MRPRDLRPVLLLALALPACASSAEPPPFSPSASAERAAGEPDGRPILDLGSEASPEPEEGRPRGLAPEGPDPVIAVVDGREVRTSDLARFFLRYDPAPALEALNQIIDDSVLEADAAAAGVVLPEGEVEARTEEEMKAREVNVRVQYGSEVTLDMFLRERFGFTRETYRRDVAWLVRLRALRDRLVRYDAIRQESVRFRVLWTADEEKAREAAARLRAGADFTALARQVSVAPPEELPPFRRDEIRPEALSEELFAMAPGEVSRPVRKALEGRELFGVFKILERRAAREVDYASVAAEIEKGLRERPVGTSEYAQWARRARERRGVRILLEVPAAAPAETPAEGAR